MDQLQTTKIYIPQKFLRLRYLTFQMIIGGCGTVSDAVCVGSPVIIIIYKKTLTNKYTEKFGIFN